MKFRIEPMDDRLYRLSKAMVTTQGSTYWLTVDVSTDKEDLYGAAKRELLTEATREQWMAQPTEEFEL